MAFSIITWPLLDTIQDLGRSGFGNWALVPRRCNGHLCRSGGHLLVECKNERSSKFIFPVRRYSRAKYVTSPSPAQTFPTLVDEVIPRGSPLLVRKNTVLHFPSAGAGWAVLFERTRRILYEEMAQQL